MSLPFSIPALYHLTKFLYQKDVLGEDYLAIKVGNFGMQLRIELYADEDEDIEYMLHFEGADYARKNIAIYADGTLDDRMVTDVPDEDLFADEEPLAQTIEEVAAIIYETLLVELAQRMVLRTAEATNINK